MKKFIFFSKTYWSEQPRLRHQLANLLLENGNTVIFFEKPDLALKQASNMSSISTDKRLKIVRARQLVHHQLRVNSFIQNLNARFEVTEISRKLRQENEINAVVVNFNYDYFFLRKIFPKNLIVTVINDDFIAQSRLFRGRHAQKALELTCKASDAVLVVSYPLADQVAAWCDPQLFLPWADVAYQAPAVYKNRKAILIWAHIDKRIDFALLEELVLRRPDIEIHFCGAISTKSRVKLDAACASNSNFFYYGSSSLNKMRFEEYFCSVIPYLKGVKDIEAVTLSNKTLQLMARGLPIITHGMPGFLRHDAIFKCKDIEEFVSAVDFCQQNFNKLQISIERLVSDHQKNKRYQQFLKILNNKNNLFF